MAVNQTRNSFNGGARENTSTVLWSYPPVPFSGHDMPANLDMLIRRTSRHPLPVEIIRNIVNQVSVTGFYTLRGSELIHFEGQNLLTRSVGSPPL